MEEISLLTTVETGYSQQSSSSQVLSTASLPNNMLFKLASANRHTPKGHLNLREMFSRVFRYSTAAIANRIATDADA